jgi:hypothetical protein
VALRQQPRGRPATIEELLSVQRESAPARCDHCTHEIAEAALRDRVRMLEDRVAKLEAWLCGLS